MNIETKFYRENEIDFELFDKISNILTNGEDSLLYDGMCDEKNCRNFMNIMHDTLKTSKNSFLAVTHEGNYFANVVLVENTSKDNYHLVLSCTNSGCLEKQIKYIAEKNCINRIKELGGTTIDASINSFNETSSNFFSNLGFTKKIYEPGIADYKIDLTKLIIDDEKLEG